MSTPTTRRAETVLLGCLAITVLDLSYLAVRYTALRFLGAESGTGLCSISSTIDCDPVLLSAPARAFYLPNAYLGFGFFVGATLFFVRGRQLDAARYRTVISILTVFLGLATLVTFHLFRLLVRLPTLCPLCPWNHVFTWVALGASVVIVREQGFGIGSLGALRREIAIACVPFVAAHVLWVAISDEWTRWP